MKDRTGFRTLTGTFKRHVVTAPGGVANKNEFVEEVAAHLRRLSGEEVRIYHVGNMMYECDPTIPAGRILTIDPLRLRRLRSQVMKQITEESRDFSGHVILNTRGVFRGQFSILDPYGLDIDQLRDFGTNTFFTLLDNVQTLWHEFNRGHARHGICLGLQQVLEWREEEVRFTREVSRYVAGPNRFFCTATHNRDRSADRSLLVAKLMQNPNRPKLYTSFPMTHVAGNKVVADEIAAFKKTVESSEDLVYFDPADVDEFFLCLEAREAKRTRKRAVEVPIGNETVSIPVEDLIALTEGIDQSIVTRDLLLVEQSDLVFALVPEVGDLPALSAGVEAEVNFARWSGRLIHVCWKSERVSSPFSRWGVITHRNPGEFIAWMKSQKIIS